jgi:hypothetical protein
VEPRNSFSSLARCWLGLCCTEPDHLTKLQIANVPAAAGCAITALKDNACNKLFTRHISNFRVLCLNRILGIGPHKSEQPTEDARKLAATWGSDPVYPSQAAYKVIAELVPQGHWQPGGLIQQPAACSRYHGEVAKGRPQSEHDDWVSGCAAAGPTDAPWRRGWR